MARAVGLLSRREYSRFELERRLRRGLGPDDDPAEVERVLDRLQRDGLLSDTRFATSLVRLRAPRYGDLRIARDLRERGVAPELAESALAAVDGTEARRALDAWARRFTALPTTADERGRQGRYLQARGFTMDTIVRVLAGKVPKPD